MYSSEHAVIIHLFSRSGKVPGGANHYELDTGTIVSENVRNGYCTYGFRRI